MSSLLKLTTLGVFISWDIFLFYFNVLCFRHSVSDAIHSMCTRCLQSNKIELGRVDILAFFSSIFRFMDWTTTTKKLKRVCEKIKLLFSYFWIMEKKIENKHLLFKVHITYLQCIFKFRKYILIYFQAYWVTTIIK